MPYKVQQPTKLQRNASVNFSKSSLIYIDVKIVRFQTRCPPPPPFDETHVGLDWKYPISELRWYIPQKLRFFDKLFYKMQPKHLQSRP